MLQQECFHLIRSHFKSLNNVLQRPQTMSGTQNESMPDCHTTPPFITFHFPHAADLHVEHSDQGEAASEPEPRVQPGATLEVLVLELVALHIHQSHLRPGSFARGRVALHGGWPGETREKSCRSQMFYTKTLQSFSLPTLEGSGRFPLNQTDSVAHFFFTDNSRKIMETTRHCQNDDKS